MKLKKQSSASKPQAATSDLQTEYDENKACLELTVQSNGKQVQMAGGRNGLGLLASVCEQFSESSADVDDEHWFCLASPKYGLTLILDQRRYRTSKSKLAAGGQNNADHDISLSVKQEESIWYVQSRHGGKRKIVRDQTICLVMNKAGAARLSGIARQLISRNQSSALTSVTVDPAVVGSPYQLTLSFEAKLDDFEIDT